MMLPLPWACMARTSCFMLSTTPRTLVSKVAAKLSAVWSVIGPTWPSVAALFTATSRRPNRATVLSTMARTSSSLRTSVLMNSASEPRERSSLTSALPASSRRPATTTFAPFFAKATAAARPMPVKAPVINTTGLPILVPHDFALLTAEYGWQRREAWLRRRLSAVDREHLTGCEGRLARSEEDDRVGDLVRLADTLERNTRYQAGLALSAAGEAVE